MEHLNVRNLLAALVAIGALSLTACNTVQGVGEDAQSVGRTIEDGAK